MALKLALVDTQFAVFRITIPLFPASLLMLLCQVVSAQTFTGAISGRVTDPAGLPVADVEVAATETATNETSRTVTNRAGDYNVAFLKPGPYRVTFTAKGFKAFVQVDLDLQLNQSFRLDPALQIGAVTESVEVTSTQSEVNYDSPEGAHIVGSGSRDAVPADAEKGRKIGEIEPIGRQRIGPGAAFGRQHVEKQLDQALIGICFLATHSTGAGAVSAA